MMLNIERQNPVLSLPVNRHVSALTALQLQQSGMEIVYGEFLNKLISRGVFSSSNFYGNESIDNPVNQLKEYNGFDTRDKLAFQNHIVLKKKSILNPRISIIVFEIKCKSVVYTSRSIKLFALF